MSEIRVSLGKEIVMKIKLNEIKRNQGRIKFRYLESNRKSISRDSQIIMGNLLKRDKFHSSWFKGMNT